MPNGEMTIRCARRMRGCARALLLALMLPAATGTGRTFRLIPTSLPPVFYRGMATWGDFDGDGRLDVAITGYNSTNSRCLSEVWRNTGSGFTDCHAGLSGINHGDIAAGDYDGDGRLDIALAGLSGNSSTSEIWHNTATGFVRVAAPLLPMAFCSVNWVDYDGDGRLDLHLVGESSNILRSQLLRNTTTGFVEVATSLPGVRDCAVAWCDYDGDLRRDVLITGSGATGALSGVWRNTSTGFVQTASLPAVYDSAAAWADFDRDGRPDLVIAGLHAQSSLTQVWRNEGGGRFSNTVAGLPAMAAGQTTCFDYDRDGWPDLLLSSACQLWRNTGAGLSNTLTHLPPGFSGAAIAGDYDNDGWPDLLFTGCTDSNDCTQLWRNEPSPQEITNHPPAVASNLVGYAGDGSFVLFWDAATDGETASSELTYDLRMGATAGSADLLYTNVGAVQMYAAACSLPMGVYHWSLRAVDGAQLPGDFAPDALLSVSNAALVTGLDASDPLLLRLDFFGGATSTYTVYTTTNLPASFEDWQPLGAAAYLGRGRFSISADTSTGGPPLRLFHVQAP